MTSHITDGAEFLRQEGLRPFDVIDADAWPGKFSHLDEALVRPGGMYVIDDLLPQANWLDGHAPKVPKLISEIESRSGFMSVRFAWASGLMVVVVRRG